MSTPDRDLQPEEALRAELEAELEAEEAADLDVEADPVAEPDAATDAQAATVTVDEAGSPEAPEVTIAFSPRQILGGFALIAAIVVWLFRRRKR